MIAAFPLSGCKQVGERPYTCLAATLYARAMTDIATVVNTIASPRLSVVIAVLNEAGNIALLISEAMDQLQAVRPFEIIFVDDGSTDSTAAEILTVACSNPLIRLLQHDRRCGKSAALQTGVRAARGRWIATMDGDGQNDPADLPPMLLLAETSRVGLIAGVRTRRIDTLSKRLGSRLANRFRRSLLGDHCPDTGCGVKMFRQDDFLRLPAFEGMHRFLPALFQLYGHGMICHPVQDRARRHGQSNYTNFGRAVVGIGDMLGVLWLRRRTIRPGKVVDATP